MLNPEWQNRIDCWHRAFRKALYKPLGPVAFEGFVTRDQLTLEQALARPLSPFPPGTPWGGKWEYGWFRGRVSVPAEARGERIVLRVETGGEAVIFVGGKAAGARGWSDREITLTPRAEGGEEFEIVVEAYAGHGVQEVGGGPSPFGHEMVPEPPAAQVAAGNSTFGIWQEEVYQLLLDFDTLLQLSRTIKDPESLRLSEIHDALMEVTLVVDFELPGAQMLETARAGRALLKPLLDKKNGPTAPFMHCFGHAHIDVAWLWPLQETERKCARTFSSQLALMEQYPEYKFLQSQCHLYWMTKRLYPELYARIQEAVKKGGWIPEGGMWVEADTNITGGESLIRQFLVGKRFFKEEFGVESRLMWLPDVFGYSGAMPQIMRGCGIDYFSTQKIFWTYHGGDPFPFNWFWWEGIDGTRTLCYMHNDYNSEAKPENVRARWAERVQKESFHQGRLMPFGFGDGGGGPTRDHLEYLRRQADLEGGPKCRIRPPVDFFDDMKADAASLARVPTWVGELYFQCHRGTYTTQAKTKKGNRLSEFALREVEFWGAALGARGGAKFDFAQTEPLWRDVLLGQFHDIIPGSSIHRVYEEAEAMYAEVIRRASSLADNSRAALLKSDGDALTVFNSLSWDRPAFVELPAGFAGVSDAGGKPLTTQICAGKTLALVPRVPASGWTTLRRSAAAAPVSDACRATGQSLENGLLRVEFNASGQITSLFDKTAQVEFAAGACNAFRLYKDVPNIFDAWDIDSNYKRMPVPLDEPATITAAENGPLVASLKMEKKINGSLLAQEIILRAGSPRLDFKTRVDWRESHKLLKVNFPVSLRAEDALHEIQFGHVRRPTHATRPYDAARFEVCHQKWTALAEENRGAAVLNDCKYGVSVEGNSINLTLLRSPLAPDMTADKGVQEFTYAFYFWSGRPFLESGLVREGYGLNIPVTTAPGDGGEESLFQIDAPNIILETVKPAEDGSGDIVLRLYESARTTTRARLTTSLPAASAHWADMLENPAGDATVEENSIALEFRPFEIKTLRLKL